MKIFIFLLAFLVADFAIAQNRCDELFVIPPKSKLAKAQEAINEWLNWEQTQNYYRFHQERSSVVLNGVPVSKDKVEFEFINSTYETTFDHLQNNGQFLWPQHPYNQSNKVPFFGAPSVPTSMTVEFTASSSLATYQGGKLYSYKIPTDHPFKDQHADEPTKADRRIITKFSVGKSKYIADREKELKAPSKILFLYDVAVVKDVETKNGIVVRDLTPMTDGHRYIPLFSIPYIGREIAAKLGVSFNELWGDVFKNIGAAKAELLLNYGLVHITPNSQNFLVQLDQSGRPTGIIVMRDLVDTAFYDPVAKPLGAGSVADYFRGNGDAVVETLSNQWAVVFKWFYPHDFRVNLGEYKIRSEILTAWRLQHDLGYLEGLEKMMGVQIPNARHYVDGKLKSISYYVIDQYLKSPEARLRDLTFDRDSSVYSDGDP